MGAHRIRPELEHLAVSINDMRPHPDNPNNGDDDGLRESLQRTGQYRPIVLWTHDSEGIPVQPPVIIAGHTTQRAALSLGWDVIAAEPFHGSGDEARRVLLADNAYARRARMDMGLEVSVLQQLEDLTGTGYTDDDLAGLIAELDKPLSFGPDLDAPQPSLDSTQPKECPFCHERWRLAANGDVMRVVQDEQHRA
jgi:hypothetical protein